MLKMLGSVRSKTLSFVKSYIIKNVRFHQVAKRQLSSTKMMANGGFLRPEKT